MQFIIYNGGLCDIISILLFLSVLIENVDEIWSLKTMCFEVDD